MHSRIGHKTTYIAFKLRNTNSKFYKTDIKYNKGNLFHLCASPNYTGTFASDSFCSFNVPLVQVSFANLPESALYPTL